MKFLIQGFKGRTGRKQTLPPYNMTFGIFIIISWLFLRSNTPNLCSYTGKPQYYFIFVVYEVVSFIVVDLYSAFFTVPFDQNSTCLPSPGKINTAPELFGPRGLLRYSYTFHKPSNKICGSILLQYLAVAFQR